jgi:hypothetical protein
MKNHVVSMPQFRELGVPLSDLSMAQLFVLSRDTPARKPVMYCDSRQKAVSQDIDAWRMQLVGYAQSSALPETGSLFCEQVLATVDTMIQTYDSVAESLQTVYSQAEGEHDAGCETLDTRYRYPLTTLKNSLVLQKVRCLIENSDHFLPNLLSGADLAQGVSDEEALSDPAFYFSDRQRSDENLPWLGGEEAVQAALYDVDIALGRFWGTARPSMLIHTLAAVSQTLGVLPPTDDQGFSSLFWDYPLPDMGEQGAVKGKNPVCSSDFLRVFHGGYTFGGVGETLTKEVTRAPFPPADCSSFVADHVNLPFRTSTLHHFLLQRQIWQPPVFSSQRSVAQLAQTVSPVFDMGQCGDMWFVRRVAESQMFSPDYAGTAGHIGLYLTDVIPKEGGERKGLFLESNRDLAEEPSNFEGAEGCGLVIRPKSWLRQEKGVRGKETLPDCPDSCRVHGLQRALCADSKSAASMGKHSLFRNDREDLPTAPQPPFL